MITLDAYFMGRQQTHRAELTNEVKRNAPETVRRANLLLSEFYAANPGAATRTVNSGWRPPSLNATVPGAAKFSRHMTAEAIDLSDDDGALDAWAMTQGGQSVLEQIGLWMEHPSHTPRWFHGQIVPPKSQRRIFYP